MNPVLTPTAHLPAPLPGPAALTCSNERKRRGGCYGKLPKIKVPNLRLGLLCSNCQNA